MKRLPISTAAIVLFLAVAIFPAAAAPSAVRISSVDSGSFPKVVLRVQVVDEEGRPVVGLDRSDFSVFEDGRKVDADLSQVFIGSEGVGVILAIDVSGSMRGRPISAAKRAAEEFLGNLTSFDRAGVIAFGDGVRRVIPVGSERLGPLRRLRAEDATTHLYDGVLRAAQAATRIEASRRAVVVLTDGKDEGSTIGLSRLFRRLPRDVSVHTVGLRSESFASRPLRQIAKSGGGTYREATAPRDLLRIYRDIARDLRAEYLLTYSAREDPNRPREVVVTVGEGQRAVSAVDSYRPPGVAAEASSPTEEGVPIEWWVAIGVGGVLLLMVLVLLVLQFRARRRLREGAIEAERIGDQAEGDVPGPALVAGLRRYPLRAEEIVVGRSSTAGIQLEDGTVSRIHARLWQQNGELYVEDLDSANGTWVNGERVEAVPLTRGDRVRFGDAEFTYEAT